MLFIFEGGLRYYFEIGMKFWFYVVGCVGVVFVDDIKVIIMVFEVGIVIEDFVIYDNFLVFMGGFDLGFVY